MRKVVFYVLLLVMCIVIPAQGSSESATVELDGKAYKVEYSGYDFVDGQLQVTIIPKGWAGGEFEIRNGKIFIPVWASADCGGQLADSLSLKTGTNSIVYTVDCSVDPDKIYVYAANNEESRILLWEADESAGTAAAAQSVDESGAEAEADENSDSAGIALLLEALNEPIYDSTLEMLRSSDPIRNGVQGDAVRGVQTLLNEFGKNLPVTGGFYNMSLAALQDVERVFGMEKTDYVDAAVFEQLLINLQVFRNLEDPGEDGIPLPIELEIDVDQRFYLEACAWEMKGKFYQAYKNFWISGWADFDARAEACVQKWPQNGEIYHNPSYYSSGTVLKILVGKDDGQAMLIKIMRGDTLVSALFLGNGTSVTASLPAGAYTIKTGVGENWFGINDAFGEEGYYETLLFDDGMRDVTLDYGYEYTLRLNFSGEFDPEADDVGSETENYDDF